MEEGSEMSDDRSVGRTSINAQRRPPGMRPSSGSLDRARSSHTRSDANEPARAWALARSAVWKDLPVVALMARDADLSRPKP
jgi:hypothetical protein